MTCQRRDRPEAAGERRHVGARRPRLAVAGAPRRWRLLARPCRSSGPKWIANGFGGTSGSSAPRVAGAPSIAAGHRAGSTPGSVPAPPASRRATRRRAMVRTTARTTIPRMLTDEMRNRANGSSPQPARSRCGRRLGREEPVTSNDGLGRGPVQPAGNGPAGAGRGPSRAGGLAPSSASQSLSNPARLRPSAAWNAASSRDAVAVRADQPRRGRRGR